MKTVLLLISYIIFSISLPAFASDNTIIECVPNESSFSKEEAMMKVLSKISQAGTINTLGHESVAEKYGHTDESQTVTTNKTVQANVAIDFFKEKQQICAKTST